MSTRRNEKSTRHQQSGGEGMRLFKLSFRACFAPTQKLHLKGYLNFLLLLVLYGIDIAMI